MTSTGWVSAGPLSAYFGDSAGLVDLGAVVDGHRCALRGIVVRLATGAAPGVIRFGSDDTQRLVSMQATNPNVNRRENRMLSFDFEGVVEDGDVVDLRPGEERTLVLRLAPFGASSRGSGLKRFSSVPWRTTCRLTLGPNVISFDVSARFCRSLLAIDTKEILFECAVDSSDTRELMVQNFSDIATWFSLRVPSSDCFTFVDCATLSPILPRHPLAGSGQVNVRMIYRPRSSSVGDNTHELVLENCLDERNVERVPIIASVTLESREQGLVLSPDIVDFGDCVSGETIWRTITLKNATRVPLEIFLTSNASGGHKVLFCLEEPTETQQGNNAADPLVASPTASDDDDLGIHIPLGGSAKNLSGSRPLSWAPSTKEGQSGHSRHPSVSLTDFLELSPPPTVSDKVRNLVEELTIPPGKERVLRIFFTGSVSPSVSHSSSGDGNRDDASSADALSGPAFPDYTRLQPLKFHLFLNCRPSNMLGATIHGKYSRVVRCIARLCTSLIAVSTSALNFGEVAVSQSSAMSFNVENLSDIPTTVAVDFESKALHQFSLVISNMSDVPILYRVAKSGSIASDDLVCSGGDLGVIRPYQIREIPFVFKPSLAGRFLETVTFENVQDSDDKQAIYVKADIKKPFNFWLQTVELDFGYCLVGERSRKRRLLVKNISDRVRRIRIKVDNSQLPPTCSVLFELGEVFLGPATSIDREEEREKLENKLRIAERKGQKEKLKKIRRRLAELRRESSSEFECGDFDGAIDGQGSSNSLLLTLPPNAVQNVFVTFVSQGVSRASSHAALRIEAIRGVILVHEEKNKDYIRDVNFWARVCSDNEIYQRALSGNALHFSQLPSHEISAKGAIRINAEMNSTPCEELSVVLVDTTNMQRKVIPISVASDLVERPLFDFRGVVSMAVDVVHLGPCFVDPITSTFEKVYRLRLTNKSTDTDLSAALSCNLPTQVNFFDSQSCVAELSKVRIPKSASQVVFVRFNLKLDHDYAKQGKCREVRGAFRVHLGLPRVTIAVYEPENDSLTYTDDSEYCLDFGTITTSRPCLRGRFAISNPSDLLDFEYRLVFSSSAIRFLEASSVSGVVTCGQSLAFEFEACVSQFGIFEETIALEHVPTHTSVASLRVTCFYDCQALQVQLPFRNRYALLDCSTSYAELSNESTYTVNLYRQVNSCTITNVAPDERTLWLCASIRRGALLVQWASAPGSGTPDDASRIFKQVSYGESATLRIELPHTYAIGQRRWNELASGRPVAFRRRVLVRGRHEDAVLACFAVSGTVAVSLARIDESYVDVGRVGFENGWKDVVVSFTVVNEADIELHYQIKSLCCCFPVAADDVIYSSQTLEPGGRRKHDVVFSPSLVTSEDVVYPSGTFEFHIDVVNLFNSRNENLRLRVLGQLVNCPIQFTHLDSDGCLKLPPVSPYEQSGVSTESFAIVNRDSETSHEIHLDVHTFEEFRDLCSIKVLVGDRSAVNEFVLHAAEQREVRVRIVPSPGYTGRWPTRAGLCSVGSISFLAIGSTKPQVVILQTSFSVDAQFSVSLPRIKFRFTETNESRNFLEDHFWIRNLSSVSPVSIRLSLRSPQPPAWISLLEFSPTHADLAPEASVRVDVYFKSQTGRLVSSPVYIDVIDNSNSLAFKSVEVALVAEALSRTASVPLMTPSDGPVALGEDMVACNREQCISALGIRGAMPVAGSRNRYIINAGQQELGVGDSAFLDWDIVVENQLPGTIEFQLEVINTDCDSADWIRLSKLNGTLHAIHESFTITLSMSTSVQGTFSAYVLLRNSRDIEIQTIRAELVVVKPAALSGKVFEVVVDGGVPCDKGAAPTIDIGDIFLGQSNSNRSFVITNTSSIPIETLVAADLDPNSQACVHFSLTPMALSMFNIITIQPSTSVRVFVHFQTSSSSSPMGIHSFERVAFDIKIGCRIVNDYQASIRYVATCRPPQLQLSTTDINFSGVLSGTLVVSPEEVLVGVSRLYEGVASVSIRTESRFFVVEDVASLVASSAPGPKRVTSRLGSGKATFRVCPQLSALASLAGSGVYVEEHFTRLFYFSPGSKQGHTFTSIEGRIADFAMRFQSFFHDVGNACPHRALSEWDVASLHDFCVHLLSALSTAEYWDLYSEYFYLTDELVYLSLKCHIGQFVLQLANLLYGFTMRHSALRMAHRICVDTSLQHDPNLSMFVSAWTDRLLYFLCHFPGSSTSLDKYLADLKLPHT
ncbi:unnamed protein product (mitochondrion) [Plasmodiophora brassicae]|uniref:Uncharacterized protein n=1 Tax=Plasmodiophora brassicae TaxID=37360 RepID=A0A3P3YNA6_PLABS|nr:unnamed protein product [Plasmodiophora brassicae]